MTTPVFLSPALPSELLSYILDHHGHPTTLIICSSQAEFLASVVEDIRSQSHTGIPNTTQQQDPQQGDLSPHQDPIREEAEFKHALLSSPLYQVATSRHIRVIYVPTVTHLRAYLAVFSPDESRVPIPPTSTLTRGRKPHLILYGFLKLHRDTSEWSAQGLSNTTAILVDLVHRLSSWDALLVEPRDGPRSTAFEELLHEAVPILNGGARRLGPDSEEGAWTGRTVEVGRILRRWSRFQRAQWNVSDSHD
ncbi:hypothetical protein NUW58_g3613 [Xylaria curta]|uniref:Uncharacterized protein n=2 Tax=Xylaria curta TaxID=42375 RepID=A0ACC1PAP2_9PEZI|nr:hypothetical protein NUW58_g5434 [Xylaria curta]KAJ2989151.1 hypothetical protein NUW58_g3613 [Xylaria curta]